jgi:hypothetical protein
MRKRLLAMLTLAEHHSSHGSVHLLKPAEHDEIMRMGLLQMWLLACCSRLHSLS